MDESTVGEVHLLVRAAGEEGALRERAEGFTRAVIGRVVELLEARLPGRLIFLGRLPLRWTLDEATLAEPASIERLAREVVDAVGARLPAGTPLVATGDEVVVFSNEVTWRA